MKRIAYLLSILCLSVFSGYLIAENWTEEGGSSIQNGINVPFVNCTSSMTLPTGANSIAGGGAGTGLDSDKLDGQHGSYYLSATSGTSIDTLVGRNYLYEGANVIVSTSIKNQSVTQAKTIGLMYESPSVIVSTHLAEPRIKDYPGVIRSSHTIGFMMEGANVIKGSHTIANTGAFNYLESVTGMTSSGNVTIVGNINSGRYTLSIGTITGCLADGCEIVVSTGFQFIGNGGANGACLDFSKSGLSGNSGYYAYGDSDSFWRANSQFQESNIQCTNVTSYSGNNITINPNAAGDLKIDADSNTDIYMGGLANKTTWYNDGRIDHDSIILSKDLSVVRSTITTITTTRINPVQGVAGNAFIKFSSSDSWGAVSAGGAPATALPAHQVISMFVPGDAYTTTGIAYYGRLDCRITLASATASVSYDGDAPAGNNNLNFNIMHSSGTGFPFLTIFNSTTSLRILNGQKSGQTTDFALQTLHPGDIIRLDIGDVGSTTAGGDPLCVTLYGTQQ